MLIRNDLFVTICTQIRRLAFCLLNCVLSLLSGDTVIKKKENKKKEIRYQALFSDLVIHSAKRYLASTKVIFVVYSSWARKNDSLSHFYLRDTVSDSFFSVLPFLFRQFNENRTIPIQKEIKKQNPSKVAQSICFQTKQWTRQRGAQVNLSHYQAWNQTNRRRQLSKSF